MLNRSASLGMSTCVLKALPSKLDIKRHSPSILHLSISLTTYKTTVVSQPHRHVSKRSQFTIPKNLFCVIVQDTSSLLLSTCSIKENVMTEILLTVT